MHIPEKFNVLTGGLVRSIKTEVKSTKTKIQGTKKPSFYVAYIYIYIYTQGVPGGKDLTSGECSLGQTIPI
jgi:hypothetical protein